MSESYSFQDSFDKKVTESNEKFKAQQAELYAKFKAQQELVASPAYQNELKYINRISDDIALIFTICMGYGLVRPGKNTANSLFLHSTSDLYESIKAVSHLVEQGLINSVKRELRYIIESSVKYLYVDQQTEGLKSSPEIIKRLDFLETNVESSIDIRNQLKLEALHPDDAKQFINELYDIYRKCCSYVHVSRSQIQERLDLIEKGQLLSFKTVKHLQKIGRLIFRVYDIILTLYFHNYSLPMTGDIFIEFVDDRPEWKFHKGKYVSVVSAYFDYKHERNMRKYGESRPHSSIGWPPKRL
jgi:hypothetical protein